MGGITLKTLLMVLLSVVVMTFSVLGYAAEPDTCALLIAEPDLKADDFMNKVHDCLQENKNVVFGTTIQTKYQEYWLEKGELEEGKPTPQVLLEFKKYSGYDKCLYIIADAVIEKSLKSRGLLGLRQVEKTRATVNLKGFLVGKDFSGTDKILKVINVTQNADSNTSDLRAKRGAFERAVRELVKNFNESLRGNR